MKQQTNCPKYTIKHRLSKLNKETHTKKMRRILARIAPVSRVTFWRWCNITQGNKMEIPYSAQQQIAEVLECTVDELTAKVKEPC